MPPKHLLPHGFGLATFGLWVERDYQERGARSCLISAATGNEAATSRSKAGERAKAFAPAR
jgi:hypothetical protein